MRFCYFEGLLNAFGRPLQNNLKKMFLSFVCSFSLSLILFLYLIFIYNILNLSLSLIHSLSLSLSLILSLLFECPKLYSYIRPYNALQSLKRPHTALKGLVHPVHPPPLAFPWTAWNSSGRRCQDHYLILQRSACLDRTVFVTSLRSAKRGHARSKLLLQLLRLR